MLSNTCHVLFDRCDVDVCLAHDELVLCRVLVVFVRCVLDSAINKGKDLLVAIHTNIKIFSPFNRSCDS